MSSILGKKTKKCKMVEKKLLTEMIESIRKEGTFINNPTDTEELLQLEARLDNIIIHQGGNGWSDREIESSVCGERGALYELFLWSRK